MVPFSKTFSDLLPTFQGHGHGVTIDAVDVLCAQPQLTRHLFATAYFLVCISTFTRYCLQVRPVDRFSRALAQKCGITHGCAVWGVTKLNINIKVLFLFQNRRNLGPKLDLRLTVGMLTSKLSLIAIIVAP